MSLTLSFTHKVFPDLTGIPLLKLFICLLLLLFFSMKLHAQDDIKDSSSLLALKKLSLEELMSLEITSVSKRPEKLLEVSASVQVITQEDIRTSGATNVPEALRLATNLQVAQVNSSQWAISARGFNNVLANKLLVLIDGRVVYTPMYAGVFWDVQNLVLSDVERIEVISGPGGTLWGANAVNGVINIITKNAKDTKGLLAEAIAGTELLSSGTLRYGGKLGNKLAYRVYGTAFKKGNTFWKDSINTNPHDSWHMWQTGFRLDWDPGTKDAVSLQSNFYSGKPDPDGNQHVIAMGGNMVGRWNHNISEKSDYQVQGYFDQTWRDFRNGFAENLKTYDLEAQHRFWVGKRNEIVWGAGGRLIDHKVDTLQLFAFIPPRKLLHTYNAFVQDKIIILHNSLSLTLGYKLEHNNYVKFQHQPSARLCWTPGKRQAFWTAISRAVRTPSRIDREFVVSLAPGFPLIQGDSTFKTEEVLAYELGWRIQPMNDLLISLSTFYNYYDNLRSAEPGPIPIPPGLPITFGNGVKGETYGAELSVSYQLTRWWYLRGGYTFLKKHLWVKADSDDLNNATTESNDPMHQFLIQSNIRLPKRFEFGTVLRYVGKMTTPAVSDYAGLDVRIGWKMFKTVELSVVGQNLLNDSHTEFIPDSAPRQIQRSVYGKITVRF